MGNNSVIYVLWQKTKCRYLLQPGRPEISKRGNFQNIEVLARNGDSDCDK